MAEVFSPPRVGPVAENIFGLERCHIAIDLKTGYDLTCPDTRRHVLGTVLGHLEQSQIMTARSLQ
eukprot:14280964-Alexandrium_andersonii.AAC.1